MVGSCREMIETPTGRGNRGRARVRKTGGLIALDQNFEHQTRGLIAGSPLTHVRDLVPDRWSWKTILDRLRTENVVTWTREGREGSDPTLFFARLTPRDETIDLTAMPLDFVTGEDPLQQAIHPVLEHAGHSIYVTRTDGTILYANPEFEEITGYTCEEARGRNPSFLQSGYHEEDYYAELWETIKGGETWHSEVINHRKDGEVYVVDQTIAPIFGRSDDIVGFVAVNREVTSRWVEERQRKFQTRYDSDLGILTREAFRGELEDHLEDPELDHFSLYSIRLDNLQEINTSFGFDAGNEILRILSNRFRMLLRSPDLIGRFGGDQFVILSFQPSNREDSEELAEQISAISDSTISYDGLDLSFSLSVGLVEGVPLDYSPDDVLTRADRALAVAEQSAQTSWRRYHPEEYERVQKSHMKSLQLRSQIERGLEREEFLPFYQPIVCLEDRTPVGLEVLVRWNHPDRGTIGPGQFLEEARESRLLQQIESQVFRQALEEFSGLKGQQGPENFSLHLNLEPTAFQAPNLPERVERNLSQHGLGRDDLNLEVVESDLLRTEQSLENVHRLVENGISLSIDDFGTGYSALDYLVKIPADTVKIDRSLIKDLTASHPENPMLESVISMVQNLGKTVVGEGVETIFQRQLLRDRGCEYAQGYFYSRPCSLEEISRYLDSCSYAGASQEGRVTIAEGASA